jgi:hypothetical protein
MKWSIYGHLNALFFTETWNLNWSQELTLKSSCQSRFGLIGLKSVQFLACTSINDHRTVAIGRCDQTSSINDHREEMLMTSNFRATCTRLSGISLNVIAFFDATTLWPALRVRCTCIMVATNFCLPLTSSCALCLPPMPCHRRPESRGRT